MRDITPLAARVPLFWSANSRNCSTFYTGMNWLSLPAGRWKARPWQSTRAGGQQVSKAGLAQLEADIFFADLVSHAPEGEWLGMAPMRILSFDIECAGRPGVFPDATQVISFEKEAELLATWHRFLIECDADIVTGYNIVGFDLPYLITRADTLKASSTH
eukprot:scaffold34447_cov36-Tisochrysis_lutea.AAC.2